MDSSRVEDWRRDPVMAWSGDYLEQRFNKSHDRLGRFASHGAAGSGGLGGGAESGDVGGGKPAIVRTNHAGERLPDAAPKFIAKDEPGHKVTIVKRGATIATATAVQFGYSYGDAAGTPFVVYTHSGRDPLSNGELFHRGRFVAHQDGLTEYDSEGMRSASHPNDRKIRYWAGSKNK